MKASSLFLRFFILILFIPALITDKSLEITTSSKKSLNNISRAENEVKIDFENITVSIESALNKINLNSYYMPPSPDWRPSIPSNYILDSVDRPALQSNQVPSTGTATILVILIDFPDQPGVQSMTYFNNLLLSGTSGSLKNYYTEVSYGLLTITGVIAPGGWYRSAHNMAWWGDDILPNTPPWVDNAHGFIYNLAREAVLLADPDVNYAAYDTNSDGVVDAEELSLCIIHSGSGQESTGYEFDIWSHRWAIYGAALVVDGVSLSGHGYWMQAETSPMGTFAHEFGHDMGLPDLYDTDYSSDGIGRWGLMSGGSWNGIPSGSSPAHPSAWCKIQLGWITPTAISPFSFFNDVAVLQIETNPTAYKLSHTSTEYFLVVNREKTGYDSALPGSGILIWHIDELMPNNRDEAHKLVDLEEAHGGVQDLDILGGDNGGSDDPFASDPIGFTDTTIPNSRAYYGSSTEVMVTDISVVSSTMTVDFGEGGPTTTTVSANPASVYPKETSIIYVEVKDSNDDPVPDGNVVFTCDGGTFSNGYNSITLSLSNGQASDIWTAPNMEGKFTITANYMGYEKYQQSQDSTSISVSLAGSLHIEITISPSIASPGDGIQIDAMVRDDGDHPIDGATVSCEITRPNSVHDTIPLNPTGITGKYSNIYSNTNNLGTYQVSITASHPDYRSGSASTTFSIQESPPPAEGVYYLSARMYDTQSISYPYSLTPSISYGGNTYLVKIANPVENRLHIYKNGGLIANEILDNRDLRIYDNGKFLIFLRWWFRIGTGELIYLDIWFGTPSSGPVISPRSHSVVAGDQANYDVSSVPSITGDLPSIFILGHPTTWHTDSGYGVKFPDVSYVYWGEPGSSGFQQFHRAGRSWPSSFTMRVWPQSTVPSGTHNFQFMIVNREPPIVTGGLGTAWGYMITDLSISITALPPEMSVSIGSWSPIGPTPGVSTQATITVSESGGASSITGVTLQASDISGPGGHSIPGSQFSFDKNNFDVPAGGSVNVIASLAIPSDTLPGTYTGTINVNSGNAGSIPLALSVNVQYILVTTVTSISSEPSTILIDKSCTVNVNVKYDSSPVPGGSVTLTCNGGVFPNSDTSITLPLSNGETSTTWTAPSTADLYMITATYNTFTSGNKKYQISTGETTILVTNPQLSISLVYPSDGATLTTSSILLKARITSGGYIIQGATVNFYIDDESVGSVSSDSNGYASYDFFPSSRKSYTWFATAEKPSYDSVVSDTWVFTIINVKPSMRWLRAWDINRRVRLDPGGDISRGRKVRMYARVSDIETATPDLTVFFKYRPQGDRFWTTEAATYHAHYGYWYYDWNIPGNADLGLYDVLVRATDPDGGSTKRTETGEFRVVSVKPIVRWLRAWDLDRRVRLDPGGDITRGRKVRMYARVSDIETATPDLTVFFKYRPQGDRFWTTEAATYHAHYGYWYYDWNIPGNADLGLYDVLVRATNPHGESRTLTETGEFRVVS